MLFIERKIYFSFDLVNVGFELQRTLNYKTIVDEAIKKSDLSNDSIKCIIFNRSEGKQAELISQRDRDWNDLMDSVRDEHDCVPVESNHPLYLLYTSGIFKYCRIILLMNVFLRYNRYTKSNRSSNRWLCCNVTMDNEISI